MSRPVIADQYPASYFDLMEAFENGKDEVVISFDTLKAALDFRLDFYAFRGALQKDGTMEIYSKAKRIVLRVVKATTEGGKASVVITSRDRSQNALAVAAALGAMKQ